MDYKETIKELWKRHLKSFVKTYLTVFLALYLKDVASGTEGSDITLLDWGIIITNSKWALVAVLRNVYKFLAE